MELSLCFVKTYHCLKNRPLCCRKRVENASLYLLSCSRKSVFKLSWLVQLVDWQNKTGYTTVLASWIFTLWSVFVSHFWLVKSVRRVGNQNKVSWFKNYSVLGGSCVAVSLWQVSVVYHTLVDIETILL